MGSQPLEFASDPAARYAAIIRSGRLSCAEEVRAMMDFSSRTIRCIRRSGSTATAAYLGPDGRPLDDDGELVRKMGEPEAWRLTPERQGVIGDAIKLFLGKQTELDMPATDLPLAGALRSELALILGLDNPHRFTFDQLAAMAGRYAGLSRQVLPDSGEARVIPQEAAPDGLPADPQPPAAGKALVRQEPARPADLPIPQQRRKTEYEVIPRDPAAGEIRSHRRPPGKGLRALGRIAVAAVAAASIFAGGFLINAGVNGNKPNQAGPPAAAEAYASPPEAPMPPSTAEADRMLSIGGPYDPLKRTGTIQYVVEKGAAALGYPNLTPAQTHRITGRTLKYMNERLPGGMSWAKARNIRPATMLPFPPPDVLLQWIRQVVAEAPGVQTRAT